MRRVSTPQGGLSVPPRRSRGGGSSSGIDFAPFRDEDDSAGHPSLPALPRLPPPNSRHYRPSKATLLWACATAALVVYYQLRLKELTTTAEALASLTAAIPTRKTVQHAASTSPAKATVDGFAVLNETLPHLATASCEVCHLNPANPLCEYGYDNIRMSRAYEGSGARLRKVLAKALRGEEIGVGVLGASITAGHSVPPGYQRWQERWVDDFKKVFPQAKLHVGAIGAMDSQFFSFCFGALVPDNLDIYLVELDINNEPGLETLRDDDALMRGLLQLPQEPAVIRVSAFQVIFDELARGVISSLVTSQYFDVPVIGIRNFLLPHVQHHRKDAEVIFGFDQWGNRDYRHISEVGHIALADMLSLYVRKEICETQRRVLLPKPPSRRTGPWPSDEDAGKVPPLQVYSSWRDPTPPDPVVPHCQTIYSDEPIVPVQHTDDFTKIEWNGKAAWSSSTPGGQIRFKFKGTKVGLFVWVTNGQSNAEEKSSDPAVKEREAPGMAKCWVEEMTKGGENWVVNANGVLDGFEVNSHVDWKPAPQSDFVSVAKNLDGGEHVLACEVLPTTTSGGHKWRLQGIASQ
ncbi:hypothetical protein JCM10449v2_005605 [Rhodotorula kratochvilovae]